MQTEMPVAEAIVMMNRCKEEILNLRAQIATLAPKADAYDNLARVLRLLPQPSVGMGEDLAWTLGRRIRELEASKIVPDDQLERVKSSTGTEPSAY